MITCSNLVCGEILLMMTLRIYDNIESQSLNVTELQQAVSAQLDCTRLGRIYTSCVCATGLHQIGTQTNTQMCVFPCELENILLPQIGT